MRHLLTRPLIASALMLLTLGTILFLNQGKTVSPKINLSNFPKTIDQYIGSESYFDKAIYDALGVDDSTLVSYQGQDGKTIQLYVGFHNSQREGDLMHSPKNCLPGSGWDITQTSLEDVVFFNPGRKDIKAIRLLINKGRSKQVVLYWFQSRGRFISSEYLQKIYLVLDSITKNRTDGSFVRLMTPVSSDETVETTTERLKNFAGGLIPILEEYLPGKTL